MECLKLTKLKLIDIKMEIIKSNSGTKQHLCRSGKIQEGDRVNSVNGTIVGPSLNQNGVSITHIYYTYMIMYIVHTCTLHITPERYVLRLGRFCKCESVKLSFHIRFGDKNHMKENSKFYGLF